LVKQQIDPGQLSIGADHHRERVSSIGTVEAGTDPIDNSDGRWCLGGGDTASYPVGSNEGNTDRGSAFETCLD
jgi:hypothetical protein